LIKERYVDAGKIDSINQLVINEMLSHLDPHSVFIPSSHLSQTNEDLMGNFQGIGIEYQLFNDSINVINLIKDGPGEKAGLQVGDVLLKANDTIQLSGKKIANDDIRKSLRGVGGSLVKLSILRNGKIITISVTRGNVPIPTIDAAYMVNNEVGYLKINKFGDRTYEEFMQNLEKLQKQGMKKLVLDLRGNGGGLMNEATAIADEFLDEDKLIVYTEGSQSPRMDYKCKKEGLFEKGKLAVLIDETSASASEVLSGALQDWDRATIIGRRSFGKGLVQQQFNLSDGSAVRLTVARYYTPLGRNIQKPYNNKSKEDYENELYVRFHDMQTSKVDSSNTKGKAYKTPSGHTVYGGGGITPDIQVPVDTSKATTTFKRLLYRNSLSNFVYHYYLQHKATLGKITNAKEVAKTFIPSETEWSAYKSFSSVNDGIDLSVVSATEKSTILNRMQALLAHQIAQNEGYYEIYNQSDSTFQKAISVLK
jgi:carboxyl-terminal processing protease